MVLKQKLGIAEVPPDIRIIHAVARKQELERCDEQGQDNQKRANNPQAVAKARTGPNGRFFSRQFA
jgi:hypothetical protein